MAKQLWPDTLPIVDSLPFGFGLTSLETGMLVVLGSNKHVYHFNGLTWDDLSASSALDKGLGWSPAELSSCVYLFDPEILQSEANGSVLGQMTDSSLNGNHGVQATSGNRGKVIHSAWADRNAVLFQSSGDTNYVVPSPAKHIFIGAAFIGASAFPNYVTLARSTDTDYQLFTGETGNIYWRGFEISGTAQYAVNGREVSPGNSTGSWPANLSYYNDVELRWNIYEVSRSTEWTTAIGLGLKVGSFPSWNGFIGPVALFDSVLTGDDLRNTRQWMSKKSGVPIRL